MTHRAVVLIGILVISLLATSSSALAKTTSPLPLVRVTDIRLPGQPTRFDYQAIDSLSRRLYVAHLGDSNLDVIDLDSLRVVATVHGLPDVHGVTVAPDRQRIYATATSNNQLVTINTATNQSIARVTTGDFPDGVTYDPDDNLVFVSDKNDGSLTVIDAARNTVTDTIKIGDETGNVADDPTTRTIYAAARTPDTLAVIDPATRRVTNRIPLQSCAGAHGVYIDRATQRAFVACEHNARLVTVDLRTQRQNARMTVGPDPDVLAFDPDLQRLYVAAESGTVSVFDASRSTPHKIGQAHLADAAHTVAVDPTNHRVYLPLQDVGGRPVLRVMKPLGA